MVAVNGRAEGLAVIVARWPGNGAVKTRLSPPLDRQLVHRLYECFLRDALDSLGAVVGVDRALFFTPAGGREYFERLCGPGYRLETQGEGDLGARFARIVETALGSLGYRFVLIVGSDHPDLPPAHLQAAVDRLAGGTQVVLGPARDGGYYLIGTRGRGDLFSGIPWSTGQVFELTRRRVEAAGLSFWLLPQWQDIDTYDDLRDFLDRPSDGGSGRYSRALIEAAGLTGRP